MGSENETTPERPALWMGFFGFSPQERSRLENLLDPKDANSPAWRVSPLGEADAWLMRGGNMRVMGDGSVRVPAGLPTEHALRLNLKEIGRPIAVSGPVSADALKTDLIFDLASDAGVHAVLRRIEASLRPVLNQFVLGAEVLRRDATLQGGVYDVIHEDGLLARLDFPGGKVAFSSLADPEELRRARWERREGTASAVPGNFGHCTPSQLAWVYAWRTTRDVLPPHYRVRRIYFRRAPRVPVSWLNDSQLMLLRELTSEPGDLNELSQRTGIPSQRMLRELACLYYAGSLTTTRSRAAGTRRLQGEAESQASLASDSEHQLSGAGGEMPRQRDSVDRGNEFTVPASLERTKTIS